MGIEENKEKSTLDWKMEGECVLFVKLLKF